MKSLSILKYALCLFAISIFITSCSKENSDEKEEIIETTYEMEVMLRGVSTTYDVYAAYCNENGIESFSVSNNLDLLGNDAWGSDIAVGDFVVHQRTDANGTFTLAGVILESTLADGTTLTNFTTAVDDPNSIETIATVNVSTANSTEIIGSMSGDFLVLLNPITGEFDQVPFSVRFAGEVDSSITPIFCE